MFINLSNEELFMLIILSIIIFAMGVLLGIGITETKKEIKNKVKNNKKCYSCNREHQRYDKYCLSCEDIKIGLS